MVALLQDRHQRHGLRRHAAGRGNCSATAFKRRNPFFERRLITAADRELSAHGFELRPSGNTDLVLHFHASVSQRLDVSVIDGTLGACSGCGSSSLYDAGTIMLDLVDPKTNTLLWRAWSEGSIDGLVDDQKIFEQRIDDAMKRIVATLPKK